MVEKNKIFLGMWVDWSHVIGQERGAQVTLATTDKKYFRIEEQIEKIFMVVNKKLVYDDAKAICHSLGGDLAHFSKKREMDMAIEKVEFEIGNEDCGTSGYFVGIVMSSNETNWVIDSPNQEGLVVVVL